MSTCGGVEVQEQRNKEKQTRKHTPRDGVTHWHKLQERQDNGDHTLVCFRVGASPLPCVLVVRSVGRTTESVDGNAVNKLGFLMSCHTAPLRHSELGQ